MVWQCRKGRQVRKGESGRLVVAGNGLVRALPIVVVDVDLRHSLGMGEVVRSMNNQTFLVIVAMIALDEGIQIGAMWGT